MVEVTGRGLVATTQSRGFVSALLRSSVIAALTVHRTVIHYRSLRVLLGIRKTKYRGKKPRYFILVGVFITDQILRHSAEVVETYSQSAENACVYKEFCNTKGI